MKLDHNVGLLQKSQEGTAGFFITWRSVNRDATCISGFTFSNSTLQFGEKLVKLEKQSDAGVQFKSDHFAPKLGSNLDLKPNFICKLKLI